MKRQKYPSDVQTPEQLAARAERMRLYRLQRKKLGLPVQRGAPTPVKETYDPEDYSHPMADVRVGP